MIGGGADEAGSAWSPWDALAFESVVKTQRKCDIEEDAIKLGWDVTHLPARGIAVDEVVKACKGADMMMWARTHNYNPVGNQDRMLSQIEDGGTVTVGLHLDLYWGVGHREAQIGNQPWWSCNYVFTADGGHQKEFAARDVNHFWCPPPIASSLIGRGVVDRIKYPHKYVFVGGIFPPAHGRHRVALLRWAKQRYGRQFKHYEGRANRIWGPELTDLYTTAFVTLGDSAPGSHYWSDRVVQTLGRGGLLAHPVTPGMAGQGFTEDVLIPYRRGQFQPLGQKIEELTEVRRKEISDAAMTLLEEWHTWKCRLLEIQKKVFE